MRLALFVVAVSLLMSGCASMESIWQEAQQKNNVFAYEAFLKEYPQGKYASTAKERIEKIKFEQMEAHAENSFKDALRKNSIKEYKEFIRVYPNSRFVPDANQHIRDLNFAGTHAIGTVLAYENFLHKYPQGPDSDQLQKELPALRAWERQKLLGELIINLCPKTYLDFDDGSKGTGEFSSLGDPGSIDVLKQQRKLGLIRVSNMSTTFPTMIKVGGNINEIRKLLENGVDPNAIRIAGFQLPYKKELGNDVTKYSTGSPGHVVPANEEGMTLLEYCKANKLDEVYELLKAHGVK